MDKEIEELMNRQKKLLCELEILSNSLKVDEFLKKVDEFLKLGERIIEIKEKEGVKNGK